MKESPKANRCVTIAQEAAQQNIFCSHKINGSEAQMFCVTAAVKICGKLYKLW